RRALQGPRGDAQREPDVLRLPLRGAARGRRLRGRHRDHAALGRGIGGVSAMDAYTLVHVALSLAGIVTGFVVFYGMLTLNRMPGWTAVFLLTTLATSLTGFGFPYSGITPAIIFGIVSVVALAVAMAGLYAFRLAGAWRLAYVLGAILALYLNTFVL